MSDLVIQQYFSQVQRSGLNKSQIDSATKTLEQVKSVMEEFRKSKSNIMSDANLSGQGRETRIAQLGSTTNEQLENLLDTELKNLDSRIHELTEQIRPQNPSSNELLEHMRQIKIRDMLYPMDELKVMEIYQSLSVSGKDDLTMRAIEEAPVTFPLITDAAILEAGKRARGERQSPESTETLNQLKQWRATLEGAMNTSKSELNIMDETVLKIAATGTA